MEDGSGTGRNTTGCDGGEGSRRGSRLWGIRRGRRRDADRSWMGSRGETPIKRPLKKADLADKHAVWS